MPIDDLMSPWDNNALHRKGVSIKHIETFPGGILLRE